MHPPSEVGNQSHFWLYFGSILERSWSILTQDNPDTAPKPGYIHANNSAVAWAVEDLTVYVTHYYYSVFYVQPSCKDWTLKNVRVRAVAWAMLSDPSVSNGRGNRLANVSTQAVPPLVRIPPLVRDLCDISASVSVHTG